MGVGGGGGQMGWRDLQSGDHGDLWELVIWNIDEIDLSDSRVERPTYWICISEYPSDGHSSGGDE